GETRHEEERKGRNYYRREIRYGAFTRTLPLATEVKSADAQATYKDGVLEIRMPKSERVKPTSVKVQAG
ncbi:MAG TPA: Hsp20/alpha crystallin family protein, partial [Gaiellaceae bacterium]|nr:Hsp20/alpha crystallin family protein [Gaiellaceae bacterium]